MRRVAVAGGTGLIGRMVTAEVRAAGHTPVVIARSSGVNLISGSGLAAALADVEVVIDVSNLQTTSKSKAQAFFATATTNLLTAEQNAGVGHHIALSIVGSDRIPLGYYAGKQRQEELIAAGPVPGTILRATQFFEFAEQMLRRGGPFAFVPSMLSQPVAAREVAQRLVDLAGTAPSGHVHELAGPETLTMPDMVRRLVKARGEHRLVVPLRLPGAAGRGLSGGGLLPTADGPRGKQTFTEWLATDAVAR